MRVGDRQVSEQRRAKTQRDPVEQRGNPTARRPNRAAAADLSAVIQRRTRADPSTGSLSRGAAVARAAGPATAARRQQPHESRPRRADLDAKSGRRRTAAGRVSARRRHPRNARQPMNSCRRRLPRSSRPVRSLRPSAASLGGSGVYVDPGADGHATASGRGSWPSACHFPRYGPRFEASRAGRPAPDRRAERPPRTRIR